MSFGSIGEALALLAPGAPQALVMAAVALIFAGFVSVNVMFLIWLERKVSGRIQSRMGPMLAGPRFLGRLSMWTGGIFQTPLDALKLLFKEDITPGETDRLLFVGAPFLMFIAAMMTYVVIPFGPGVIVSDLNIGVLYIVAAGSLSVIAVLMAGWGSGNKWSLMGGFRSAAQLVSYEVPLVFALLGPVLMAGTLSMQGIVVWQERHVWLIVPQILGFLVFLTAGIAETNRPPFDLPEAETELIAGFVTEYSGMKFAMFFLSEFSNMFILAAVSVTLFLGGWSLPFGLRFPAALAVPGGVAVFFVKTYLLIWVIMWIRWTFPRLRVDQVTAFTWKLLLPTAFLNLAIAGALVAAGM